jgi:hypothetical protein
LATAGLAMAMASTDKALIERYRVFSMTSSPRVVGLCLTVPHHRIAARLP